MMGIYFFRVRKTKKKKYEVDKYQEKDQKSELF